MPPVLCLIGQHGHFGNKSRIEGAMKLGIPSLERRDIFFKLTVFYKILKKIIFFERGNRGFDLLNLRMCEIIILNYRSELQIKTKSLTK